MLKLYNHLFVRTPLRYLTTLDKHIGKYIEDIDAIYKEICEKLKQKPRHRVLEYDDTRSFICIDENMKIIARDNQQLLIKVTTAVSHDEFNNLVKAVVAKEHRVLCGLFDDILSVSVSDAGVTVFHAIKLKKCDHTSTLVTNTEKMYTYTAYCDFEGLFAQFTFPIYDNLVDHASP
jgi:hypothetical protein